MPYFKSMNVHSYNGVIFWLKNDLSFFLSIVWHWLVITFWFCTADGVQTSISKKGKIHFSVFNPQIMVFSCFEKVNNGVDKEWKK